MPGSGHKGSSLLKACVKIKYLYALYRTGKLDFYTERFCREAHGGNGLIQEPLSQQSQGK